MGDLDLSLEFFLEAHGPRSVSCGDPTPVPHEPAPRGGSAAVAWIVAAVLAVIVILLLVAR